MPSYLAAQTIAPLVAQHFARLRGDAPDTPAVLSDIDSIEALIDAAFWASLRREEGYVPRVSLTLLGPEQAVRPLRFERPLPLTATALVRVAPAVERPGIHLAVSREDGELRVWGTTQAVPAFAVVLEVAAPGLLVIKHHRGDLGKFINVAVIEGDQVKVVDERSGSLPDCPALVSALIPFSAPTQWSGSLNVLVELAVSMRAHGRGGSLLVVPSSHDGWRSSIANPIPYPVQPPFETLAELAQVEPRQEDRSEWRDALTHAVSMVAGLTAVDGATIVTDRYALLGFGAKIVRRDGSPQVEQVVLAEPIEGTRPTAVHPGRVGGTRHSSAAQFVYDQRDAIALVASQDGRFTVFAWSPCEAMVYAYRVETLLL
jgi:hypothetical protein